MTPLATRLGFGALLVGLLLPLASLPPFALGYWDKAEPLVIGLHLGGALAAFALAAAPALAWSAIRHPFVLLPLALAAWSVAMAPFVELPWLSLSGAPQSGLGAVWFLDFALLIAVARLLRLEARLWRSLGWVALAIGAMVAGLKLHDWGAERSGDGHLLIWVAAYYAWLGLALPLIVQGKALIAALGIATALLLAGRSISAGLGAVVGLALFASFRFVAWPRSLPALAVVVAATAPGMLIAALPVLQRLPSTADRLSLLAMVWAEICHWRAKDWLTGIGWGRTQDVFHSNLAASGQRLWDGSWIFMSSDYFHSHNGMVEAVLAAGLPGGILALASLVALPLFCRAECRPQAAGFAVALAVMGAIWFPLALSLPLIAMAMASLASDPIPRQAWRPSAILLTGVGGALAGLAGMLLVHGIEVGKARADIMAGLAEPRPIPPDPRGTDLAAAEIIRDAFRHYEGHRPPQRIAADQMIATLKDRIGQTRTVLLPVTGLSLMAQIETIGSLSWLNDRAEPLSPLWERWLDATLRLAPRRGDLAVPYLGHLATQGDMAGIDVWVTRLLARDPTDPTGLYFRGLLLVQHPDATSKTAGITALRASAETGIERFMPLDPSLAPILGR
jgi:hypothetical protein